MDCDAKGRSSSILCSVMRSFVVAVFELVELQHYGKHSTCKKTYIAVQRPC